MDLNFQFDLLFHHLHLIHSLARSLTTSLAHSLSIYCISPSHALFTLQPEGGEHSAALPAQQETESREGPSQELIDELVLTHCLCFPRQVRLSLKQDKKTVQCSDSILF